MIGRVLAMNPSLTRDIVVLPIWQMSWEKVNPELFFIPIFDKVMSDSPYLSSCCSMQSIPSRPHEIRQDSSAAEPAPILYTELRPARDTETVSVQDSLRLPWLP